MILKKKSLREISIPRIIGWRSNRNSPFFFFSTFFFALLYTHFINGGVLASPFAIDISFQLVLDTTFNRFLLLFDRSIIEHTKHINSTIARLDLFRCYARNYFRIVKSSKKKRKERFILAIFGYK